MYVGLVFIVFTPVLVLLGLAIEEYLEVRKLLSRGTRTTAEVTNVARFEEQDAWQHETYAYVPEYSYEYFLQYHDHNDQLKKISSTNLHLPTTTGHKIDVIYYKHYVRVDSFRFLYGKLALFILAAIGAVIVGFLILEHFSDTIIFY